MMDHVVRSYKWAQEMVAKETIQETIAWLRNIYFNDAFQTLSKMRILRIINEYEKLAAAQPTAIVGHVGWTEDVTLVREYTETFEQPSLPPASNQEAGDQPIKNQTITVSAAEMDAEIVSVPAGADWPVADWQSKPNDCADMPTIVSAPNDSLPRGRE